MGITAAGKFGFTATVSAGAGMCRVYGIVEAADRKDATAKVCEYYDAPAGRVTLREHTVVTHRQIVGAERGNVIK